MIRENVWLNGEPLAVIEGGVVNYIRTDHIGRPVFATNSTGTKTWTATYLPFGEIRTTTGTTIALRFPGQWFQSESGLHQNWMRDYDPTTGRYLEADPLGLVDGTSVYGYVKGNPGRWVNRRGTQAVYVGPAPLFTPIPGTRVPTSSDYGKAVDEVLNLSHNYNPIDLAIQWCTEIIGFQPKCKLIGEIWIEDTPGGWPQEQCIYDCGSGCRQTRYGLGLGNCSKRIDKPNFYD